MQTNCWIILQTSFAQGALRYAYMVEVIGSVVPAEIASDPNLVADKTIKASASFFSFHFHLISKWRTMEICSFFAHPCRLLIYCFVKSSTPLEVGRMGNQFVAKISKTVVPVDR
jgi:hypothetical protein